MKRAERQRFLAPVMGRIQMMVSRIVLTRVDDDAGIQSVQAEGLADEVMEAERVQNYGYTSVPHPDAEGVAVFPGGLRSHPLIIAVDDRRYRLKGLKPGEVAIYDDLGQVVHLTREGVRVQTPLSAEIEAGERIKLKSPVVEIEASERFTVTAPDIELNGATVVGGEADAGKPIARHDDLVVGGKVVATAVKARAV